MDELDSVEGIATDRFLSKSVGMLQQQPRGIEMRRIHRRDLAQAERFIRLSFLRRSTGA